MMLKELRQAPGTFNRAVEGIREDASATSYELRETLNMAANTLAIVAGVAIVALLVATAALIVSKGSTRS